MEMAVNDKAVWLKVLIGFLFSLLFGLFAAGNSLLEKKVDKEVFNLYRDSQTVQFQDIKSSLERIEDKL